MALFDDVRTRRELVKRLVLAELLARPGQGPLALQGASVSRWLGRARAVPPAGNLTAGERPKESG